MQAFTLAPRGPFGWSAALEVLRNFAPIRRHARTSDAEVVRLAFPLDGTFEPVAVALRWTGAELRAEVRRAGSTGSTDAVARQVARVFSLDHDGTEYARIPERAPAIRPVTEALPGLRPVCFTSPYESAAWAVISQRISKDQAARVQDALLEDHGRRLTVAGAEVVAFPDPDRLARVRSVPGLSAPKLARLHAVAEAARDGRLDVDRLRQLGDERAPELLRTIPGIGPFWSSGVYLRACGIADVFPEEPLSIAALGRLHGLGDRPALERVRELTEAYRPFRMWICFALRVAAARGVIPGVAGREGSIRRAGARTGARARANA